MIRLPLIGVCCLALVANPAIAGFANFVISILDEKWSGLTGVVSNDGEPVKLPALLWEIKPAAKPDEDVVFPRPIVPFINRLREIKEPWARFDVAEPVLLRIRGQKIKFEKLGGRSTTLPSDFDGLYLAYSLKETELQLKLSKSAGKETEWKIVDAERRMLKSRGEYQYNVTQSARFRLEAANRPGWFLYADNDRGMCLSAELKERRLIELEVEKHYDDHSDGK